MNKMSAKHFVLFILGAAIISFITYPSLFISIGGRDTWISFIIAFLIFLAFAMYIVHIIYSKKPSTINSVFTEGLSTGIGNIFLFLFSVGLFISSIEAVSVEANAIRTNFFQDTPIWYIIIFFLIPSFFIIGKKFSTILIFLIISISFFFFNGIALLLIVEQYKNVDYLLPVLNGGVTKIIFSSAILILGSLSSFSIVLPYIKFIDNKSKLKKHSLITLLITGFICIYTLIDVIAVFGPLRGGNLFYPSASSSQLVQYGGFLEFGELFFLFQTIFGFFIKYILCTCGIYIIYRNHIKNSKAYITVYTIAVFIISFFFANSNYYLFNALKYYQVINIILLCIVPLLGFLCYNVRNNNK